MALSVCRTEVSCGCPRENLSFASRPSRILPGGRGKSLRGLPRARRPQAASFSSVLNALGRGPARSPALGGQGKRGLSGRSWQAPGARTGVSLLESVSALAGAAVLSCPSRYSKNRNTLTHLMNLRLKTSIKIHFDPQSGSNLNLVDAL